MADFIELLRINWVRSRYQDEVPDSACLLEQGIALHVLDSVKASAPWETRHDHSTSLLIVDSDAADGESVRTLLADDAYGLKPKAWLVRSDVATQTLMQDCVRAGALDWVPRRFSLDYVGEIVRRHFDSNRGLRLDSNNRVPTIDSHSAMARTQSDVEFFGSLLKAFFDELPGRLQDLRYSWIHNPVQFTRQCHSLKGLSATLGLPGLNQTATEAEAVVAQADPAEDDQIMVRLEGELLSARFQIMRWLYLHRPSNKVAQ